MSEKIALPKLRFSEFKDSGAISLENGNVIFEPINNKKHNSDLPVLAIFQEHGAIPREQIDYNVSVSEKSLKSYKVVQVGDFIISLRSFEGGIEYSTWHGICSPAYLILRKKRKIVEQYYKYYFKTDKFIKDLNKDLEGIRDGKMVNYSQFSSILIPLPSNEEQQKIADCLSSLDDLIAAENDKLEALKTHKKGLMQKLYPAEEQAVPEWRFPEFRDSGEWTKLPISQFGDIVTGNTPKTSDGDNYGGDIMFVTPADISGAREVTKSNTTLTPKGYSKTRKIPARSVLFVCIGSTIGKVAQNKYDCATNQQINAIVPFGGFISNFIYYALETAHRRIAQLAGKQAVPIINKTLFSSVVLSAPKNEKEQKKIANCLSAIDDKITAQAEKIEALKQHKRGLMQGLFPSAQEVMK